MQFRLACTRTYGMDVDMSPRSSIAAAQYSLAGIGQVHRVLTVQSQEVSRLDMCLKGRRICW